MLKMDEMSAELFVYWLHYKGYDLKKVRKQDDLYKTNLFEKFSNSNFGKFISLVQGNENIKTIEDLKNLKEMEDEEVSSCMTLYYNVRF